MNDQTKPEQSEAITIPCQADKEMELTPEETKHAALNAGIRGQVKKIMRVFINDQRSVMERFSAEVVKYQTNFRERYLSQVNDALTKLDKRFSGLYGDLVNRFLVKQESRVFFAELHVRALKEETAQYLYGQRTLLIGFLQALHDNATNPGDPSAQTSPEVMTEALQKVLSHPFTEFSAEFNKKIDDRVASLYKEISEQAEKEQAAQAKGEKADAGQSSEDKTVPSEPEQSVGAEQEHGAENSVGQGNL